jgi:hypothetical protein
MLVGHSRVGISCQERRAEVNTIQITSVKATVKIKNYFVAEFI